MFNIDIPTYNMIFILWMGEKKFIWQTGERFALFLMAATSLGPSQGGNSWTRFEDRVIPWVVRAAGRTRALGELPGNERRAQRDPPLSPPLPPHSPPSGMPRGTAARYPSQCAGRPPRSYPAAPGRAQARPEGAGRGWRRRHRRLYELPAAAAAWRHGARAAPPGGSHVRPEAGAPPTPPRTRGRRRGAFFFFIFCFFPGKPRSRQRVSRRGRRGRRQSRSRGRAGQSRAGVAAAAAVAAGQRPGRGCGLAGCSGGGADRGRCGPLSAVPAARPRAGLPPHPLTPPRAPLRAGAGRARRAPQVTAMKPWAVLCPPPASSSPGARWSRPVGRLPEGRPLPPGAEVALPASDAQVTLVRGVVSWRLVKWGTLAEGALGPSELVCACFFKRCVGKICKSLR